MYRYSNCLILCIEFYLLLHLSSKQGNLALIGAQICKSDSLFNNKIIRQWIPHS